MREVGWRGVYESHRHVCEYLRSMRDWAWWMKRITPEHSVQHAASMGAQYAKSHHMAGCRDLLLNPARPCTHCTWVQTFFQPSLTADIRSQHDASRDIYTEPRKRNYFNAELRFFCYCVRFQELFVTKSDDGACARCK